MYNHFVIVVLISINFWHCLLGKLQAIRFLDILATLDWQGLVKNNIFECFVFWGMPFGSLKIPGCDAKFRNLRCQGSCRNNVFGHVARRGAGVLSVLK